MKSVTQPTRRLSTSEALPRVLLPGLEAGLFGHVPTRSDISPFWVPLFVVLLGGAGCRWCEASDSSGRPTGWVTWSAAAGGDPEPGTAKPGVTPAQGVAKARPDAPVAVTVPTAQNLRNDEPPSATDSLFQHQGKQLLEAIAKNQPALAKAFFFPRKPFTPLKIARDPDAYWRHLYALYERDIRRLHRARADWTGATFVSMKPSLRSTWVAPGAERNRIGYHRLYYSKLTYLLGGRTRALSIHVIISWQGHWYITHLLRAKRRRR